MKRRQRQKRLSPSLRFSPYAWAKLAFLRDRGTTEIGGFGISAADDLLVVENVCLVKQRCSAVTVEFDDASVADHFDRLVDEEMQPERFARVWIHTHPGNSPLPSSVDEATFARVFGRTDWAVMMILACNDATYARLQFRAGPGGAWEIPVVVDYRQPFAASEIGEWDQEYRQCVIPDPAESSRFDWYEGMPADWPYSVWEWEDYKDGTAGPGSV